MTSMKKVPRWLLRNTLLFAGLALPAMSLVTIGYLSAVAAEQDPGDFVYGLLVFWLTLLLPGLLFVALHSLLLIGLSRFASGRRRRILSAVSAAVAFAGLVLLIALAEGTFVARDENAPAPGIVLSVACVIGLLACLAAYGWFAVPAGAQPSERSISSTR